MKLIIYTFSLFLLSCTQPVQKGHNKILPDTNFNNVKRPTFQVRNQTIEEMEANDRIDSVRFDQALNEALVFAKKIALKIALNISLEMRLLIVPIIPQ